MYGNAARPHKAVELKGETSGPSFPCALSPRAGVTQLLQSFIPSSMWQVGGRDREDGATGSSSHVGQAYAKMGLFLAQQTSSLAHWMDHN